jgi:hypothetical protein
MVLDVKTTDAVNFRKGHRGYPMGYCPRYLTAIRLVTARPLSGIKELAYRG